MFCNTIQIFRQDELINIQYLDGVGPVDNRPSTDRLREGYN